MKTFILFWNPAISNCKAEDIQMMIDHEDHYGANWAVSEHEQAHIGNRFFMVRCGEGNTGIFESGYFSSEPYIDDDWSGKGRVVHYIDLTFDVVIDTESCPILTTEILLKEMPEFDWTGGHSGRVLPPKYENKLEGLWKKFLNEHESMFHRHAIKEDTPYSHNDDDDLYDHIYEDLYDDVDDEDDERNDGDGYDEEYGDEGYGNQGYGDQGCGDEEEEEGSEKITQIVSLQDNGEIIIEIRDRWEYVTSVRGRTWKEVSKKVDKALITKHIICIRNHYELENCSMPCSLIPQYIKALDIASWKHRVQKGKSGRPYFEHVARVANSCKTPQAIIVALLHDVVNETDTTLETLEKYGLSEFIVEAVSCLTHQDGESFDDYLERAAKNPISLEVLIADIEDQTNLMRWNEVDDADFEHLNTLHRYLKVNRMK